MSDEESSGGLQIFAKIGATLDGIVASQKRLEAAWIQRASDMERDVFMRFSAVCPTPTAAFTLQAQEVGGIGPQPGEVWVLRAVRIGGVTPTTTAAGRGDTYQSPVDPTAQGAVPSLASWVDQATTLPLVGFYSSRQVVLRSPDNFFIVITNGTAGQQYTANAVFEVYREGAYRGTVDY